MPEIFANTTNLYNAAISERTGQNLISRHREKRIKCHHRHSLITIESEELELLHRVCPNCRLFWTKCSVFHEGLSKLLHILDNT